MRGLVGRSCILLLLTSTSLRVFGFRRTQSALGSADLNPHGRQNLTQAQSVARIVYATANYLPIHANCLARSLVLGRSTPAGARILYAGISGRGVFRSIDGGQNWTQILSAATPAVAAAVGAAPASFRKAIVGLAPPSSPPNPGGVQVLYATLEGTGGAPDPVGVFLSTDQGANWTQRTATGMPTGTQGGYSFHMAVDPGSPGDGANDIIYFGAVGHARSNDSGNTFTALAGLHADNHSWAFFPQPSPASSIVFCGNGQTLGVGFEDWSEWLAGVCVVHAGSDETVLTGPMRDQAALLTHQVGGFLGAWLGGRFFDHNIREELAHRPGDPAVQRVERERAAFARAAQLDARNLAVERHELDPTAVVELDVGREVVDQVGEAFFDRRLGIVAIVETLRHEDPPR